MHIKSYIDRAIWHMITLAPTVKASSNTAEIEFQSEVRLFQAHQQTIIIPILKASLHYQEGELYILHSFQNDK